MGKKVQRIDDIFQLDKYQLIILLFNEMLIFTMLSNVVFNIFGVVPPKILGCDGVEYNGTTKAEICAQWDADISCQQPMLTYEFYSATVEFEQWCGRRTYTWLDTVVEKVGVTDKTKFSTTLQMIGLMIGSAIAGHYSDLYGRRKILLISLVLMLFFSTASSFSPNIDVYVLIRFFVGAMVGALTTVSFVFIIECIPTKHRFWICTVVTWAPNYIIFALLAYLTREWRMFARVCNIFTLGAIIVLAFLMEESPKFLVQKKKRKEALASIININKWKAVEDRMTEKEILALVNRETGVDEVHTSLLPAPEPNKENPSKKYHFLHLYSSLQLAIKSIVTAFGYFSVSFITYSLLFNLHVIQGSMFMNTAISGVLRYIVGAAVALVDHFGAHRVGRKLLHFLTMGSILGCMILTYALFVLGVNQTYAFLIQYTTLLAFGITGCIFLQMSLAVAEQFPTPIRNLAAAHGNVTGRLGNVVGPLLFSLETGIPGFPYLVLSAIALADILLFQIFLKESKGVPLPSDMPEKRSKVQLKSQNFNPDFFDVEGKGEAPESARN